MNKKIIYGMLLIVASGLLIISLRKPFKQSELDLSYEMDYTVVKVSDVLNKINNKISIDLDKPSDTIEILKLELGEIVGELRPTHVFLSPIEDYGDGVGITFNLDVFSEEVEVIVIDETMTVVGKYMAEPSVIDVLDTSGMYDVYVYKTNLSGLQANSLYQYVINNEEYYSKIFTFETMNAEEPTTIAFFGDTQGYIDSQYEAFRKTYDIANYLTEESGRTIDLAYIAGDIVDDGGNYDQWKFFYDYTEDIFNEHQLITAIGNHDVYNGPDYYVNSFNYPSNGVKGLEERSFYVDLPYARVGVFDTENTSTYVEQAEWLIQIMSEATQPFKIVLMHRSAYPMAYDEAYIRQLSLIFEAADIDLVLSGHDHIYSRTTMKADKKVALDEGVTYIVGGSSTGSKFYGTLDEDTRYWKNVVYDDNYPVFTLIDIGEDKLEVKAYSIIEDEVHVIDSFELVD